jgi:NAD(P)-dependent dehydrogenase (short-subunit alcohol dehydrogenase family)
MSAYLEEQFGLRGRVALVTGASRGLGRAMALALARAGAAVAVNARESASLAGTVAEIAATGGEAIPLAADLGERAQVEALVARAIAWRGRLDVLVNNAGITGLEGGVRHDPEHASLADWQAVHRTNLDGAFLGCKHALQTLRRSAAPGRPVRGAIVNISSRSGLVGVPAAAAYASSKAALRNHTKSVALYCAGQGWQVRCNSIHPAAILTPMWEPMLGQGEERERNLAAYVADTPLRRFGTPAEVAALAVLLASDEAAYVTGAEFHVDGGLLAGSAATPTAD